MISVNINDVQQSEITFDHICVDSRIMPKVLLMAGASTTLSRTVLQLHEGCSLVWKEYNNNHLIFALL